MFLEPVDHLIFLFNKSASPSPYAISGCKKKKNPFCSPLSEKKHKKKDPVPVLPTHVLRGWTPPLKPNMQLSMYLTMAEWKSGSEGKEPFTFWAEECRVRNKLLVTYDKWQTGVLKCFGTSCSCKHGCLFRKQKGNYGCPLSSLTKGWTSWPLNPWPISSSSFLCVDEHVLCNGVYQWCGAWRFLFSTMRWMPLGKIPGAGTCVLPSDRTDSRNRQYLFLQREESYLCLTHLRFQNKVGHRSQEARWSQVTLLPQSNRENCTNACVFLCCSAAFGGCGPWLMTIYTQSPGVTTDAFKA